VSGASRKSIQLIFTMKQKLEIWLAAGRSGRVILHVAAAVAGGAWGWHWAGIVREMLNAKG
jgi:hypothetical protein